MTNDHIPLKAWTTQMRAFSWLCSCGVENVGPWAGLALCCMAEPNKCAECDGQGWGQFGALNMHDEPIATECSACSGAGRIVQ